MYNELGFQIAYTTQAGQAFTFAGGQISAEYVLPTGSIYEGEITTIPLNLSYSIPLTEDDFETLLIGIMGLQGPVYKLNLKNNLDIAQNYPNLINCPSVLSVVASFVATPVNDLGVFENSIKGQFYLDNTVNSSAATFAGSCDAYGEYITFVVPGTSFNLIPTNLPPYINTNEHNYLTNLSGGGINGGFQQNLAHNFTDLNFCKSSFLMGARVFGGYGQYQDDFPFEYRPLISWPSPITLSSINQQPDLPTFNQAEEINSLVDINYIFDPATSILSNDLPNAQLLQPLDKSPLPNPFYNGLALQLNRTCANGSPQYYQSTDFKVNRNAYVHWGQNDFINIDILSDINTLNFNTVFTSADNQSFTTTNYDLSFSLTPFNADLTNFYFYFELTNSAGNIVPNAQINQIPALNNYHISNSISNHLYFFPSLNDFITSVTNYQLPLNLPCIEGNYMLKVHIGNLCNPLDVESFLNGTSNNSACNELEKTIVLTRPLPALVDANVTKDLSIINEDNNCYLEWQITVNNPAVRPAIYSPSLLFNTPNGLIYQHNSSSLFLNGTQINNAFNAIPSIEFTTMPYPFQNNTLAMFVLNSPDIILNAGGSLVYNLRFNFSSELCGNPFFNSNGLAGVFKGKGECTQNLDAISIIGFNTSFSSEGIQADLAEFNNPDAQNNVCCVTGPININVAHACGETANGTLIINQNSNSNGITSIIVQNNSAVLHTYYDPIVFPLQINLPIGTYSILVLGSDGNLSLSTVHIANGTILANLTASENTVCANTAVTLTASNSNNAVANQLYTYQWFLNETQLACTTSTCEVNPTQTGVYKVIITSTSCSGEQTLTINVDQPPSPANAGIDQIICTSNTTLAATNPIIGNGVWSATNSDIIFGDPTIENTTVTGLSAGLNTLTWTVTSGVCAASFSAVNITVLLPPTADAGADQTVCGANATLAATNLSDGTWTEVSGTGNFISASSNNTGVTGLTVGNNIFKWTVDNHVCPESTDEVIITRNPDPLINLTLPTSLCSQQTYTLNVAPFGGVLYANGNVISNNITEPYALQASSLNQGNNNISYTATNSYGCSSTTSSSIDVTAYCPCACVNANATEQIIPASIVTGEQLANHLQTNYPEGKCLLITSNITISNTIVFTNCNLKFKPGKEIRVLQEGNLQFIGCNLQGCDRMWKGIWNEGKISMENSFLRDAQYGITMVKKNGYWPGTQLINTEFSHNFIGLTNQINGALHSYNITGCNFYGGGLLPNFTGQSPYAHPNGGLAGIRVFGFDISISETNTFSGLYNGIIAEKCVLEVTNAMFNAIRNSNGNNIYSGNTYFLNGPVRSAAINLQRGAIGEISGDETEISGPRFLGCDIGISAFSATIRAKYCNMGNELLPVGIGIYTYKSQFDNGFYLYKNRIKAKRIGLFVLQSSSITQNNGIVEENNITTYHNVSHGIMVYNYGDGTNLYIGNNTINLLNDGTSIQQAINGIVILNAKGIQLFDNKIRRRYPTKGNGIVLFGSPSSDLMCNNVLGWDVENEPNNNAELANAENVGIYIYGSPNTSVNANHSANTKVGLKFAGDNTGIAITNNKMAWHGNSEHPGVVLCLVFNCDVNDNGSAQEAVPVIIGSHNNALNIWEPNSIVGLGAKKPISNGEPNKFFVQNNFSSDISQFYPSHFPENYSFCQIDQFFTCAEGESEEFNFPCSYNGSSLQGYRLANTNNLLEILSRIVNSSLNFEVFNNEMLYIIKKNMDGLLFENLLQIPDTGRIAMLNQILIQSNIRKLNKVDKLINEYAIDSLTQIVLKTQNEELITLFKQYVALEELVFTNGYDIASTLTEMQSLLNNIYTKKESIESIKLNASAQKEVKIQDSKFKNSAVVSDKEMEIMERTINKIYYNFLNYDFVTFSNSEIQTIDSISFICPLIGGAAVLKARSLQAVYNDSIFYDDKELCNAQGIYYRLSKTEKDTSVEENLIVFPNPANEWININLTSCIKENYSVVLSDILGKIVLTKDNLSNNTQLDLSKANLSNGYYFITLKQNTTGLTFRSPFVYEK